MCPQCVKMYGVEYLLKKRFLRTCILEDQFLIVNIFSFHGILQALKCPLLHKYLKSALENSHSRVMTVCLYRSSEGCPEYNQRLLWRPGPQSPHCSPQSHGRTPLTPALIVKNHKLTSTTLMQFVFCFQLQLHERGMKIHEIIYEQVTETFIFTETCQNIENP